MEDSISCPMCVLVSSSTERTLRYSCIRCSDAIIYCKYPSHARRIYPNHTRSARNLMSRHHADTHSAESASSAGSNRTCVAPCIRALPTSADPPLQIRTLPRCPVCRTALTQGSLIIPNFALKHSIEKHVAALAETGVVDWQPQGQRYLDWTRRNV